MAIMQMKRIHIIALKKQRKAILETLQRHGAIQVDAVIQDDSVFSRADTSASCAIFDKNIAAAGTALDILNKTAPVEKGLFAALEGRSEKNQGDYDNLSIQSEQILEKIYRITALDRTVAEKKAEVLQLTGQLDALNPWLPLGYSMRLKETRRTRVFIGTLAGEMNLEQALAEIYGQNPDLAPMHLEIISAGFGQTCIMAICLKSDSAKVEEALRAAGFSLPANTTRLTPSQRHDELVAEIEKAKNTAKDAADQIASFAGERENIEFFIDYFTMRREKYEVIASLSQSRHAFVLSGFIPEKEAPAIQKELTESFGAAVEINDLAPDETAPVLLKNNGFSSPTEGVLESFGLPGAGEIDPTPIMSIFYYVLFGLMFSDAGYGLILVLGCGWALMHFKKMKESTKKMLTMFFFCGISTTVWGFVFGSFFGDVVNVVATTFFGRPDIALKALWFDPVAEPMRMLVFCMLIGIIHLFTGLALSWRQHAIKKEYKDILYDCVFWYMLLIGLILVALSSQMVVEIFQLGFVLPSIVMQVAGIVAAIGAVGIICTAGRESRNPFKRFLKGAYGLYNVTGYLSDVLSYSRLLALGLATGVIGTVVNSMGSMMGGGILGAFVFILVFVLGHTLNLAINLLGAYVHTNRLQFVEFFGKFYEGGGKKFTPFGAHTKYYNIKEEIYHG